MCIRRQREAGTGERESEIQEDRKGGSARRGEEEAGRLEHTGRKD